MKRVLLVHTEAEYFAGAERMLGYFLEGWPRVEWPLTAAAREGRVSEVIPKHLPVIWLRENQRFSVRKFAAQARALTHAIREERFDLVHGWAARDWELTAAAGWGGGCPAMGTLHDHPRARFISKARQRLMRWSGRGLRRIVCVSEAVRVACLEAGYPGGKLVVIRNGLPCRELASSGRQDGPFRMGYLGVFTERKGLAGLFKMLSLLADRSELPWEILLAGDAQDAEGKQMLARIQSEFSGQEWWRRVQWRGWVKDPAEFLQELDLLICPSSEFDPFPTVLLEAAQAGRAVLGSRIGGVPEVIEDQVTGWLFESGAWEEGAEILGRLIKDPQLSRGAGEQAKKRVEREFGIERMRAEYLNIYASLTRV
jgi:glycosyltransferase involved in cell wall biosynthesis